MECDTKEAKCNYGPFTQPMLKKLPARVEDSGCDDPTFSCPDGTTCCSAPGSLPGCCPLPNAVCCSDGQHCCPHKTTCDIAEQECLTAFDEIPWFKGFQAFKNSREAKLNHRKSLKCTGDSKRCLNSLSGHEFCCPFHDGVCCEGKSKCCPSGFTCSRDSEDCVKDQNGVFISMKMYP
uniref:GRANULINS domain-containing protein n=2 Tax=Bursaphelenchus xylophilus TaxID=6326 RepID=A0A1I7S0Y2_BURXY